MSDKGHSGDSLQGTSSPPPCANGCGFFGSPSTMNMCSKCFRDSVKSKQASPAPAAPAPVSQPDSAAAPDIAMPNPVPALPLPPPRTPPSVGGLVAPPEPPAPPKADPEQQGAPPPRKVQKNTSRCFSCRKKVGLTGFKCHCGYVYCSEHRYSEAHDCDYDYQTNGRQQLAKANPVVVASKLEKI